MILTAIEISKLTAHPVCLTGVSCSRHETDEISCEVGRLRPSDLLWCLYLLLSVRDLPQAPEAQVPRLQQEDHLQQHQNWWLLPSSFGAVSSILIQSNCYIVNGIPRGTSMPSSSPSCVWNYGQVSQLGLTDLLVKDYLSFLLCPFSEYGWHSH